MRKAAAQFEAPGPGEEHPQVQGCDHPLCAEPGLYRAPKTRQRLNDYYWFCLDHIRDYNRMWNYYEGMEAAEIEAHVRADTVWQRPTWPLGGWRSAKFDRATASAQAGFQAEFHEGFGFFEEDRTAREERRNRRREARTTPRTAEERALALLDLAPPVTLKQVKVRYKDLVKRLHPDANGGDKSAEERLKLVNQAYSTLKNSTTLRDGAYPWTP